MINKKTTLHSDGWTDTQPLIGVPTPSQSNIISRIGAAAAAAAIIWVITPDITHAANPPSTAQNTQKKAPTKKTYQKKYTRKPIYSVQKKVDYNTAGKYMQVSSNNPIKSTPTVVNIGAALWGSIVPKTREQVAMSRQNEAFIKRLETEKFEYNELLRLITDLSQRSLLVDALSTDTAFAQANKRLLTIMLYEPKFQANRIGSKDDLTSPDALSNFEALIRVKWVDIAWEVYRSYFVGRSDLKSQSALMANSLREVPATLARTRVYLGKTNSVQVATSTVGSVTLALPNQEFFAQIPSTTISPDQRIPGRNSPILKELSPTNTITAVVTFPALKPQVVLKSETSSIVVSTPPATTLTVSASQEIVPPKNPNVFSWLVGPVPAKESAVSIVKTVPLNPTPSPVVKAEPPKKIVVAAEKKSTSQNPLLTTSQIPLAGVPSKAEFIQTAKPILAKTTTSLENPQSFTSLWAREIFDQESIVWINSFPTRIAALEAVMTDSILTGNNTNKAKYTAWVISLILSNNTTKPIGFSKGKTLLSTYLEFIWNLERNWMNRGSIRGDIERTLIVLLISWAPKNVEFALLIRSKLEIVDKESGTMNPNLGLPMSLLADILDRVRDGAKDQPIFRSNENQDPARFTLAVQALKAYQMKPLREIE